MRNQDEEADAGAQFSIRKWKEDYWAVYDGEELVCVTVYRKGAREVVRRLAG